MQVLDVFVLLSAEAQEAHIQLRHTAHQRSGVPRERVEWGEAICDDRRDQGQDIEREASREEGGGDSKNRAGGGGAECGYDCRRNEKERRV